MRRVYGDTESPPTCPGPKAARFENTFWGCNVCSPPSDYSPSTQVRVCPDETECQRDSWMFSFSYQGRVMLTSCLNHHLRRYEGNNVRVSQSSNAIDTICCSFPELWRPQQFQFHSSWALKLRCTSGPGCGLWSVMHTALPLTNYYVARLRFLNRGKASYVEKR